MILGYMCLRFKQILRLGQTLFFTKNLVESWLGHVFEQENEVFTNYLKFFPYS